VPEQSREFLRAAQDLGTARVKCVSLVQQLSLSLKDRETTSGMIDAALIQLRCTIQDLENKQADYLSLKTQVKGHENG